MPETLFRYVARELDALEAETLVLKGLVGLADMSQIIHDDRPDLLFPPYKARFPERIRDHGGDCFAAIRAQDFVVHHPSESFDAAVMFLEQAARDSSVIANKTTIYRTTHAPTILQPPDQAAEG